MNHYVYKTTDQFGNYYIGVRSCKRDINIDKYIGSGHWILYCTYDSNLVKEIVQTFSSRDEAEEFEIKLIKASLHDCKCQNIRSQRSGYTSRKRNEEKCM